MYMINNNKIKMRFHFPTPMESVFFFKAILAVQNQPVSASSYPQNDGRRQGRSKEEEAAASLATPKRDWDGCCCRSSFTKPGHHFHIKRAKNDDGSFSLVNW